MDLLKKKTGDTGHYVLKIGVVATLFSKELIVFNEEVNEYFLLVILVIFIVFLPPSRPPGSSGCESVNCSLFLAQEAWSSSYRIL